MRTLRNNQSGVTLIELLMYLGMASVTVLVLTNFLVNSTAQRVTIADQKSIQQDARTGIDRLTYVIRNSYDVSVGADGESITVYSKNYDDLGAPFVTTVSKVDGVLAIGQADSVPPDPASMVPLFADGISVQSVQFTRVSSSITIGLTLQKNSRRTSVQSTISFRQST